jgi:hypothetical protein
LGQAVNARVRARTAQTHLTKRHFFFIGRSFEIKFGENCCRNTAENKNAPAQSETAWTGDVDIFEKNYLTLVGGGGGGGKIFWQKELREINMRVTPLLPGMFLLVF